MADLELITPPDLPRPAGYSPVAVVPAGHRLVWTSGQVPLDAGGDVVGPGNLEAQTRAVMEHVGRALAAGGASWSDVLKLTIYVTDTSALPVIRAVRDEFVDRDRPPTSSLVQVAALFRPDVLVEVEAVAAVGEPR